MTFSCTKNGPVGNASALAGEYRHPLLVGFGADESAAARADDAQGTCSFQFWVDRIESFYCKLDQCAWQAKADFSGSSKRGWRGGSRG